MLGTLIAQLEQPHVLETVLASMAPDQRARLEQRAAKFSTPVAEFAAGAVREFVDRADDELWFQLLTIIRNAEDPGPVAVQTILDWVIEPRR